MKIAILTNIRAPYRVLQINEFAKNNDLKIYTYYTHKEKDNRKWESIDGNNINEQVLKGIKISERYGYINLGLLKIVKQNDIIFLGGYEQPTMIIISLICRVLKKPYVIIFDGISYDKIGIPKNPIKKFLKHLVIDNSAMIMGNGIVSKEYFTKEFGYKEEKIINQYLTVDTKLIDSFYLNKEQYREEYRKKLNIPMDSKVLIYSGRLVDIKNIESIIYALGKIKEENIIFVVTGGGILEKDLENLANELGVKIIITGFIEKQDELFKHYFIGDAFILASKEEPWGLVVNEAMSAGLPIIVSNICGCSKDLVKNKVNGYIVSPYDINDISNKIKKVLFEDDSKKMGIKSKQIISEWSFQNSKNSFEQIISKLK